MGDTPKLQFKALDRYNWRSWIQHVQDYVESLDHKPGWAPPPVFDAYEWI